MTGIGETELFEFMRAQVATRAGVPADTVVPESQLSDLGMQSIDAVLLCGEIEDRFEIEIDPAEIFEHDRLGDFAQSLLARMPS